jgi:light-regulated signal transduction histidine kinase (bacteriophytochrome)
MTLAHDEQQGPATPPDLSECAREPIHVPGAVQPHGFLLALRPEDGTIVQVSANVAAYCGLEASALVGRGIDTLLAPADATVVRQALAAQPEDQDPVYLATFRLPVYRPPLNALLHRSNSRALLEFEPAQSEQAVSFHHLYQSVHGAVAKLQGAPTVDALCTRVAAEVRRVTGFDRVMVYRFHPDWHGEVVAEDKAAGLPPFLALHYPASDIPEQARRLYELNRTRLIPDVTYTPAALLPARTPPTDLSHAVLRSVSPVHVEYLRNMGVASSMSVSVLREGRLWGLIACHHRTPRFVPYDARAACDLIAQVLALQLSARETAQEVEHRIRLKSAQTRLLQHMAAETDFVTGLERGGAELADYVTAGGAALYFGGRTVLVGATPAREQVEGLIDWLAQGPVATTVEQELFHTDALPAHYAPAASFKGVAAGLLAVSVSRVHRSYVLWFRPEAERTVNWSGDPHRPATVDGRRRLHPRHSFELWKETVRGRSPPWQPAELDAARELRQALVGIVLKKAEEVGQLVGALERSNRELEAFSYSISHDLRAPFRHIAGFAELLQKRSAAAGVAMDETSKRYVNTIADSARYAGNLVDSLLSFTQIGRTPLRQATVDLDALVARVRSEVEPEAAGRTVEWEVGRLPAVRADVTMLHTALRNLLGNAIKYTRGREPARVAVTARDADDGQVQISVADNGVGFDMKYAEKLFGVFQRLHRPEDFPGTGIGLANVKRIVERHGGRVWAHAEPGKGATFSFTLPRA